MIDINISGLVKSFDLEKKILDGVTFKIDSGERVGLLGKNGSGKSTLLKTLYAEVQLLSGEGRVAGYDLRRLRRRDIPYLRRRIGIVFQDYQLLTDRNVFQNLQFVLKATGWKNDMEIKNKIAEVLNEVGLVNKEYKMPFQLSGGEQRRLSLLRAIAVEPDYLIMDEVTSGLDLISADAVLTLVENFVKLSGSSCIFITHSRKDAMRIANRIIIMREGRIAEQGYLIDQLSNQKGQG